ncbi:sensor histidine kinase/response regulator [Myxococcus stipitatus DSM 14675]|uniref:histidine kinase n=1 Tax=Myxococcus stipitatus (strain DSM 14675 / JCM 12634 / Mx s8) TaxID=1278073 RepID=L7UM86_MYXSD|nr:ATP-binding protein [Myxococcus stipitatus]AGC48667.1 sensor histidine kinase/response regulator [Myxococcus stipitatus DSM 14675]
MNGQLGPAVRGAVSLVRGLFGEGGPQGNLGEFFFGAWNMPHGHCYLWKQDLMVMHVVSDAFIGAAYFLISLSLYAMVRRTRMPFGGMVLSFGVFIAACGLTHFMEIWNVWNSAYYLAGGIKLVTAVASVATGLYLVPLRGKVVEFTQAARLSEERRVGLEKSSQELEALYAKLKASEEQRTRFFANVSHELRTPLTLILGPVERLLQHGDLSEALHKDLDVVRRNARMLLRHVNALLDVAKLDAGKMRVRYSEVDLARLVRWSAENFEALTAERRLALVLELPASLPAQVDPEKLERVVLNLLSNAFKFTSEGGHIRVALSAEAGWGRLVVEDNGPGVPTELREAIFERFRQGDSDLAREVGGTGLGLAITRDFVTLHEGRVWVEERPGGGARFVVELPLMAPTGVKLAERLEMEPQGVSAGATRAEVDLLRPEEVEPAPVRVEDSSRPRVLVVEDTREMRRFVVETLSKHFQVATAVDGVDGLAQAERMQPDVIVSDVMMPRMGGDRLVREVHTRPGLESTPVLLLTARADEALRVDLLRAGAQDYVVKPFVSEELVARVSNLATMKRTREVLQGLLAARSVDLEAMARELGMRKRQLEVALETTERASSSRSTLLRLVSHELRTPLSVLQLTLHALQRELVGLPPRALDMFERMHRSTLRLRDMVEMVLQYNQLEEGRLVVRREAVDLGGVVDDVVAEVRVEATRKGLGLELARPEGKLLARTDPRIVHLVLHNLMMNAVKYTEKGRVSVEVEGWPRGWRFRVRDTGPGIPPDAQSRVFEPFEHMERLENKSKPGVGLGLTLVREMVAVLGGVVTVTSQPGVGSEFTVELPS